jgi:hypothetical protein
MCSYPSSSSSFSLGLPCVDVFLADEFFVWETILRMCLSLRCGAQLADVQTCLAFVLRTCVRTPNLRTCLALRWGAQLADVPCDAFVRPYCGCALHCVAVPKLGEAVSKSLPPSGCALHCVGATNLGEVVLKSLPPSQNLFLSILKLVFFPSAPFYVRFHCG